MGTPFFLRAALIDRHKRHRVRAGETLRVEREEQMLDVRAPRFLPIPSNTRVHHHHWQHNRSRNRTDDEQYRFIRVFL